MYQIAFCVVSQPIKTIHALYGTRRFTVVFTRTRHLSVPKPDVCQPLRLILILCSPLTLGLQTVLFLHVSHHDRVHISHPCMLHLSPILSCLTFITQVIIIEENRHETHRYAIFSKKKCIMIFDILILESIRRSLSLPVACFTDIRGKKKYNKHGTGYCIDRQ